jgi:hypothetical protein
MFLKVSKNIYILFLCNGGMCWYCSLECLWVLLSICVSHLHNADAESKTTQRHFVWVAFLNRLVLFLLATIRDLVILDWLIVNKITPKFVIIPGSEKQDYEDFSHHIKGHMKSLFVIIPMLLIVASLIRFIR